MRTIERLILPAIFLVGGATPLAGQAALTYEACYVPDVGAVYLINKTGLPSACLASSHVAISWATGDLADSAVTESKLAFDPATQAELDAFIAGLAAAGTINTAGNPVDWTELKNVPTGFADGVDNSGGTPSDLVCPGCVGTTDLADAAVTAAKLATGAVAVGHLAFDPTVQAEHDAFIAGLMAAGTINAAGNPVDWTQLKNVPADFADGVDNSGGGVTDHGALTGLINDDHPQYLLAGVRDATNGFAVTGTFNAGAIPATGTGVRLMWYPRKAAFRAGGVDGAQWDHVSVGQYSSAMGYNTTASATYSTAMGWNTTASANFSTAMGYNTTASGQRSTAMGHGGTAQAYGSLAIGRYNVVTGNQSQWLDTDPLLVAGNGTSGAARSNALTLYKNGDLTIAGTLTASTFAGDGSGLTNLPSGVTNHGALIGLANDDHPQYVLADGVRSTTNGFAVTGTFNTGTIPAAGAGVRLMWYPGKAAFRAGTVSGTQWDDANAGQYSTAMGYNTTASGTYAAATGWTTTASGDFSTAMGGGTTASANFSTAMGTNTTASGLYSTAMGNLATASGDYSVAQGFSTAASGRGSTAMGWGTAASGERSTAMNVSTTAQAYASLVIGRNNVVTGDQTQWLDTDPLFVAGNGPAAQSNALTLYKNGNLTIAGTLTENSDIRLKKDIEPLASALDGVLGLTPIRYRFREGTGHPAERQIGLSAQEVEQAFPELVSRDSESYLSVAYTNLAAVLVRAVQEQQAEIEALRAEVAALRTAQAARGRER